MQKKIEKEGYARKQLKKMLDQMGETYSDNTSTKQLKNIYRRSPNKDLVGEKENRGKGKTSSDIYVRWRRQPGSYDK